MLLGLRFSDIWSPIESKSHGSCTLPVYDQMTRFHGESHAAEKAN